MGKIEEPKGERKHSKLGIASFVVGIFNVLVFMFYTYLFTKWLMANEEIAMQPGGLDGMQVPANVMAMISFLVVLILIGFLVGVFGLFEKKKRKMFSIVGILLNGILLLMAFLKL
jgi:hypothetical protein